MIARIWKAWASQDNARKYEALFTQVVLPHVTRGIGGYKGTNLLKRDAGDEVEFTTILWFDSLEAVKQFADERFERAVVPDQVKALLSRYEHTVRHHEVVV